MVNRILEIQHEARVVKSPACWDIPAKLSAEKKKQMLHIKIWNSIKEQFRKT